MISAPCIIHRNSDGIATRAEALRPVPVVGLTIWNVRVRDNRPRRSITKGKRA